MLENAFQSKLMKELKKEYPEAIIFKNDSRQGFPDITILYKTKWAFLECKKGEKEKHQPNQDYYIDMANDCGSFGRFIYPENKEEVLRELQQAFKF